MNADELYEKMKDALRFFGLSFHEKEMMTVQFGQSCVVFIYDNVRVTVYESGAFDDQ